MFDLPNFNFALLLVLCFTFSGLFVLQNQENNSHPKSVSGVNNAEIFRTDQIIDINHKSRPKKQENINHETRPKKKQERLYGMYKCTNCGRRWESGNSWKGCYQKCEECFSKVYPYSQNPLIKSVNKSDIRKPHPMELCQKCQQLGFSCVNQYK
eukprot:gene9740-2067_t